MPPFESCTRLLSRKCHQSTSDENETMTLNLSQSSTVFYVYVVLYDNILSHLSSIITSLSSQPRLGRLNIGGNNERLNFPHISQKCVVLFATFYFSLCF